MRFLANENFPLDAVEALRREGRYVAWIRTDAPGSSDEDVLSRSQREQRIVLTFDKDFGALAFHARLPAKCGVILFRIAMRSAAEIAATVVEAIASCVDWAGNFAVVERERIRFRKRCRR